MGLEKYRWIAARISQVRLLKKEPAPAVQFHLQRRQARAVGKQTDFQPKICPRNLSQPNFHRRGMLTKPSTAIS